MNKRLTYNCFRCVFFILIITSLSGFSQSYKQVTEVPVYKDGTQLVSPWAGGLNAPQFNEVDLNNDGRKDLFIYDKDGTRNLTFIHTDGNEYVYEPSYAKHFPLVNSWLLIADYNCDGIEDLFTHGSMGAPKTYTGFYEDGALKFNFDKSIVFYETTTGNFLNLYTVSTHRPIFKDINGDGDRDFLSFDISLQRIYYYENLRVERGIPCDSLFFDRIDRCWGNAKETGGITLDLILDDTCSNRFSRLIAPTSGNTGIHPGGTVLDIYDEDKNGVFDIILGDATYDRLNYLRNNGTVAVSNISAQDDSFPSYNTMAKLAIFPAPYIMDIDKDGDKDIITAPFIPGAIENYENVWLYKNNGDNSNPFRLEQQDFIVGDMIDAGELSSPCFFDYNNDGLKDLVIGNGGYFESGGDYINSLTLYENTGSSTKPEYTFKDQDYLSLNALDLDNLAPFFGDLDGDNDMDLICGESGGKIVTLRNNNGTFDNVSFLKDKDNNDIDIGQSSDPILYDFNNNGKLDLVIGTRDGNLIYYENTGTVDNYEFTYRTDSLGKVSSRDNQAFGFSSPAFGDFDDDGLRDLILGGFNKGIKFYSNIGTDYDASFNLTSVNFFNEDLSVQSGFTGFNPKLKVAAADISGDSSPEVFVGMNSGGISFYSDDASIADTNTLSVGLQIISDRLAIYPNPASRTVEIQFNGVFENNEVIQLSAYDLMGALVAKEQTHNTKQMHLDVSEFPSGIYLLNIQQGEKLGSLRLVKY